MNWLHRSRVKVVYNHISNKTNDKLNPQRWNNQEMLVDQWEVEVAKWVEAKPTSIWVKDLDFRYIHSFKCYIIFANV